MLGGRQRRLPPGTCTLAGDRQRQLFTSSTAPTTTNNVTTPPPLLPHCPRRTLMTRRRGPSSARCVRGVPQSACCRLGSAVVGQEPLHRFWQQTCMQSECSCTPAQACGQVTPALTLASPLAPSTQPLQIKNRESAARSRAKRQEYTATLEQQVGLLGVVGARSHLHRSGCHLAAPSVPARCCRRP